MPQVVIENPVINSPFAEPRRHFKFSDDGITDEIAEQRRISQYFMPIAAPKKKGARQLAFETEWTADRKEAAKEAVQGVGFDLLIVCGFAFDPHVSEEAKRYGKLTVLPTRMNPDLAMGDELLKKTGAGNLFMVFGEPDLEITRQKDGKLVVEIKGVDVYDPTTGEIRSNTTDDIACWFIDTDYNGESFFVRHAYFTGADEPYDKLKRALRAEIDEAAWTALYSTISHPFDPPEDRQDRGEGDQSLWG